MSAPTRIAIIANGTPPESAGERAALAACDACVCCDRLPPVGAPPLLGVVGDLDTLRAANVPEGRLFLNPDQETNDLTKAAQWCRERYPQAELRFFAVTGRREDHTLANLSLIAGYGRPAEVPTASGCFRLLMAGEHTVAVRHPAPISFISFVPQRVTVRGVVWPVEELLLDSLWRATLNRTEAPILTLRCEAPLFLYQPWSDGEA